MSTTYKQPYTVPLDGATLSGVLDMTVDTTNKTPGHVPIAHPNLVANLTPYGSVAYGIEQPTVSVTPPPPPPPPPSGVPANPSGPSTWGAAKWTADFSQGKMPSGFVIPNWSHATANDMSFGTFQGKQCLACWPTSDGGQGRVCAGAAWGGAELTVNDGDYTEALVWFSGGNNTDPSAYNWPALWITAFNAGWPGDGEADIVEQYGAGLSCNYHGPSGGINGPEPGLDFVNTWFTAGVLRARGTDYFYWGGHMVHSVGTNDSGGNEYPVFSSGTGGGQTVYGPGGANAIVYWKTWSNCAP